MKVLIISHNPITDYNNMGRTMLGLFREFSRDDLCQLYIYPTVPNLDVCSGYYRITDRDVINSILKRKAGREIQREEIVHDNALYENDGDVRLYGDKMTFRTLKLICRSLIWKVGRWDTAALRCWLNEQKPDIIFAAPGQSAFFYSVVDKISRKLSVPVVTYVCDDFYFSSLKKKVNIAEILYYRLLHKKISSLMRTSRSVVTICDSLKNAYSDEFGCKTVTVCSGAGIPVSQKIMQITGGELRYFGNMQLNRNISLSQIGSALDRINAQDGTHFTLNIYTGDDRTEYKTPFSGIKSVRFHGFVNGDTMHKLMQESVLLIHTESFAPGYEERVKFSVSTKIADSLASGVCLFAYGPKNIASMQHLIAQECAVCVYYQEQLESMLRKALFDDKFRMETARRGIKTAAEYHDTKRQSKLLRNIFYEVIEE